jgi:pyrimidine deaminase RibD-like protein
VGAVVNARGLVCGCVNRARKFTPHARVMFLESMRAKAHMTQVYISIARCKHAREMGLTGGARSSLAIRDVSR